MNGELSTIIADAKDLYNVDNAFTISASTVQGHFHLEFE